ncbi:serine hydrolase [Brevundimonas lenta]|uniref:CubicO group peptidase (Beta-lactamase class C family) n=1 Tax=Brevundimonas lenta TaxID=424796 RepID=A0A7W6JAU5_9CAUL|nr:serine hydrolase [Brevundimonas lenta]MBB4081713.1 CubicO group peptidase (beta-lactamase class C family) [Brevundimonas lenta]
MSIRLTRRSALVSSVAGAAALPSIARAQTPANDSGSLADQVDAFVKRAMAAFPDQPAVSVALVKDGQAVLTRGYGVRKKGDKALIDEHTRFAIASNTKAVTCAALAILIDEGKVKWDEPVRTYLPGFSLSKPELNDMVTVRDLVSHRIGFGLGAGDLLFWPNSDRTRAQIMEAVPHVPIAGQFRTTYNYCNLMFVVAGEVVAAASGMPWEQFVQTRILDKLGMTETLPLMTAADPATSALPHGRIGPPLRYQGEMQTIGQSIQEVWDWAAAGAAGGFVTNPVDWSKWIAVQLAKGQLPDGTRLWSEARANEMWKPNIIISNSAGPTAELPGRAIAATYATGWQVQDYRGERFITHGGGAPGFLSGTVLLPGRNAGFSYFTNAEESQLTRALRSGIADIVMGKDGFDWVADAVRLTTEGNADSLKAAAEIDAKQAAGAPPSLPLEAYAGAWRDPWYGDIVIETRATGRGRNRKTGLWLAFSRTPSLSGPLEAFDGETMRTRFTDRREEDTFITFVLENGAPVSATMKAVSPDADFSYDFHDLRLTKV